PVLWRGTQSKLLSGKRCNGRDKMLIVNPPARVERQEGALLICHVRIFLAFFVVKSLHEHSNPREEIMAERDNRGNISSLTQYCVQRGERGSLLPLEQGLETSARCSPEFSV